MNTSALVVGIHAVTLLFFCIVSYQWMPWMRRNIETVLSKPFGLILVAFGTLALLASANAAYYGAARVLRYHGNVDMWTDGWAFLVTLIQTTSPVGLLIAMIAHWRIQGLSSAQVQRRASRAAGLGLVLFTTVVLVLW